MTEVHTKLGKLLKGERERRGLSLPEIAQEIKIAERHIQAIEDGNLANLPGPLYFGLFAKSYAEALGIDYAKSLEAIKEDLGEPIDTPIEQASDDVAKAEPTKFPGITKATKPVGGQKVAAAKGRPVISTLIVIIVILVFLAVGWALLQKDGKLPFAKIMSPGSSTSQDSTDRNDGAGADWSEDYGKVGDKGEKAALNLQMIAHDRTWAVVLSDGDTALQINLKPWREYNIGAQEKLVVSVGSPLAVEMTINGLAVDLSDPEKGSVSSVEVTPENISMFVRKQLPADSSADDSIGPDSGTVPDTTAKAKSAVVRDTTHRRDTSTSHPGSTTKTGDRHGT
ncbi:MAG: RodZ domain-containing protein [Candidatus Zixiibacteriota bacterium]